MGSDPQILADQVAFFAEYDTLETEAEKAALLRAYRLAHGGVVVLDDPFTDIKGGLYPVRV